MNRRTQKKKEAAKFSVRRIIATVSFFIILVTVGVIYFIFSDKISDYFNDSVIYGNKIRELSVHYVDVGQGDAIIIELPDGSNILIDSGSDDGDLDVEKDNALTKYIDNLSITKFDFVIATHSDEDHIGLMETIFHNYQVDFVLRPNIAYVSIDETYDFKSGFNSKILYNAFVSDTDAYLRFLKAVEKEGCGWAFFNYNSDLFYKIKDGKNTYDLSIDFLTPTSVSTEVAYENSNDYSPIINLEYMGKRFMFTGDAEYAALQELYQKSNKDKSLTDVLKLPHHGSSSSTDKKFLDFVQPKFAIASCGLNNDYGHPHQSVLDILFDNNVAVFRTDLQGTIVARVNEKGELKFSTERTVGYESIFIS